MSTTASRTTLDDAIWSTYADAWVTYADAYRVAKGKRANVTNHRNVMVTSHMVAIANGRTITPSRFYGDADYLFSDWYQSTCEMCESLGNDIAWTVLECERDHKAADGHGVKGQELTDLLLTGQYPAEGLRLLCGAHNNVAHLRPRK